MIHPNEKPLLLQGKTLFAAFTLGFLLLLSSVSAPQILLKTGWILN